MFVMDRHSHAYVRKPISLKPSACTPLFLAAFEKGAGCCIHTHSQWAVLVTLLVEKAAEQNGKSTLDNCFEIEKIEQIKGIPKGKNKSGMLGYFDRLRVPIIENTAQYDTGLDYIFRLAVEMRALGLPWTKEEANQDTKHTRQDIKLDQTINGTSISKQGRPKRSIDNLEKAYEETPKKRKAGRPRRSLQAEDDNESNQVNQSGSPNMQGKNQFTAVNGEKEAVSQVSAKKRQGRLKQEVGLDDEASGLASLIQVARRRPGRPRKTL
ncbi:MAG: hypothetical protein Q9195_001072 [Heterodermia aff. obscurata]